MAKKSMDGARFEGLMIDLGWTSQFLADQLGVTPRQVSRWRNDEVPVPGPVWYGLKLTVALKRLVLINPKGIAKSRLPNAR